MLAIITFTTDVRVLADDQDAEAIAERVVAEELLRSRAAIEDRLTELGLEVSIQGGLT